MIDNQKHHDFMHLHLFPWSSEDPSECVPQTSWWIQHLEDHIEVFKVSLKTLSLQLRLFFSLSTFLMLPSGKICCKHKPVSGSIPTFLKNIFLWKWLSVHPVSYYFQLVETWHWIYLLHGIAYISKKRNIFSPHLIFFPSINSSLTIPLLNSYVCKAFKIPL